MSVNVLFSFFLLLTAWLTPFRVRVGGCDRDAQFAARE
jgi:hypothetical protein